MLAMSPASIDRYLAPAKAKDQLRGTSTTKPSLLLRSSIKVRKAGDEVEAKPGFFEGDTVAHCGPTLKGEFARTVNLTDVHAGWVFTRSVRNLACETINLDINCVRCALPASPGQTVPAPGTPARITLMLDGVLLPTPARVTSSTSEGGQRRVGVRFESLEDHYRETLLTFLDEQDRMN